MADQRHTYKDTNGVECYFVEHLQPYKMPDGSIEMRPTGGVIGKPVHHDTDEFEHSSGKRWSGDGNRQELDLRPIDRSIYGKPVPPPKGT